MPRATVILASVLFHLLWTTGAYPDPPLGCPPSAEKWAEWRESRLRSLSSPDALPVLKTFLESCAQRPEQKPIFNDPRFASCMRGIRSTGTAVEQLRSAERAYYDPNQVEFPAMFELPLPFKSKDSVAALTSRSVKVFEAKFMALGRSLPGAQAFRFVSQTAGLFGRDVVYVMRVRQGDFDQWIQFSRLDGEGQADPDVRIIALQRKDSWHRPLARPVAYYDKVHLKAFKGGGRAFESRQKTGHGEGLDCRSCHRVGANPIVPKPGEPFQSFTPGIGNQEMLSLLNREVAATADARIQGIDVENLGPPMGQIDPASRTDEFVRDCSKTPNMPKNTVQRLKSAMNCAGCHDGRNVNPINWPLGHSGFQSDLLGVLIRSGHMPPGASGLGPGGLSESERASLLACLRYEYFGGLIDGTLGGGKEPGTFLQSLAAFDCPKSVVSKPDAPAEVSPGAAPAR